eukprot:c21064_g1_i1.p1 GENE.c21064_g1_i1~~c21064_g1_i1.p1  ORF type:complete len:283 (-),score=101.88 c21064_g1_i1:21-869(-)
MSSLSLASDGDESVVYLTKKLEELQNQISETELLLENDINQFQSLDIELTNQINTIEKTNQDLLLQNELVQKQIDVIERKLFIKKEYSKLEQKIFDYQLSNTRVFELRNQSKSQLYDQSQSYNSIVLNLENGLLNIEDHPVLILFGSSLLSTRNNDDNIKKEKQELILFELSKVANKSKERKEDFGFFFSFEENVLTKKIRRMTKIELNNLKIQIIILDISKNNKNSNFENDNNNANEDYKNNENGYFCYYEIDLNQSISSIQIELFLQNFLNQKLEKIKIN